MLVSSTYNRDATHRVCFAGRHDIVLLLWALCLCLWLRASAYVWGFLAKDAGWRWGAARGGHPLGLQAPASRQFLAARRRDSVDYLSRERARARAQVGVRVVV